MNDIEIEIQVKVQHTKPLLDFLKKNGRLVSETRQIDEYFTAPDRDFLSVRPVKEWLRLRDADGACSINYKNWHYNEDGKGSYADEFESPIQDLKQLQKILKALGFRRLVIVDKRRQAWQHKDYEIALDSVKGLGDYVEIEYKATAKSNPDKITDEMVRFLRGLGCGRIERNCAGYPYQMLLPDEIKLEVY